MKNIAIIPARSGSKGLKDKNIKDLCGMPLLAYSIIAAEKSGMFDIIHVSTDSERYAETAREFGADVPFLRPAELATDSSSSRDSMVYSLDRYREMGHEFDTIMTLQPTSPLRTDRDIVRAYELFEKKGAETVIGVCEVDHPPMWSNTLTSSGSMEHFAEIGRAARRQDLEQYYRINGAIYLTRVASFRSTDTLYNDRCFAYVMPKERSVDIDDAFDFLLAEAIIKNRQVD